jgi:hypothetical protein
MDLETGRSGQANRAKRRRGCRGGQAASQRGFATRGKTIASLDAWRPPASAAAAFQSLVRWQRQQAGFARALPWWAAGAGASAWVHCPGPVPLRTASLARLEDPGTLLPVADLGLVTVTLARDATWTVSFARVVESGHLVGFGQGVMRVLDARKTAAAEPHHGEESGLLYAACHLSEWLTGLLALPPWHHVWHRAWYGGGWSELQTLAAASRMAEVVFDAGEPAWLAEVDPELVMRDPTSPGTAYVPLAAVVDRPGVRLVRTFLTPDAVLGATDVPVCRGLSRAAALAEGYVGSQPALLGWRIVTPVH